MHDEWVVCPDCAGERQDCTLCEGAGILDYFSDPDETPACPECGRAVEVRHRGDIPGKRACHYCDFCGRLEYVDE